MNLLVTGGAGFIGSNFTRYWLNKHPADNVVVYDKLTYAGNLDTISDLVTHSGFELVQADLLDQNKLAAVISNHNIDTIVHFAAETHVDRSISNPRVFLESNVIGTFNLLEVLRNHPQIRLHHISTDEVFGELPLDKPDLKFTEDSPYKPKSPYSASKAASDHFVRAYIHTFGIKATISNCSNNYGPACFPEKLIPLTIVRAMHDQEIPVYGDGLQVRDWIHVNDHAFGIDLILKKGQIGETYLLGGNGEKTNLWIIKAILKLLNKPESLIVHVGDRKGHDKRYGIDYSKAKKQLGFEPQQDIEAWLKETVEWYKTNKTWWSKLKPQADAIAESYLKNRIL